MILNYIQDKTFRENLMKLSYGLIFYLAILLLILVGCADSKDFESIEIVADSSNGDVGSSDQEDLFFCITKNSGGEGRRLFKAVGRYNDGSTTVLTDDVTWSSDASNDSILSDIIPGLVYCSTAWSTDLGIKITYTLNTIDSSSTSDNNSNEYTDSAFVRAE